MKVKELMIPLSGYATVSQNASLADAVKALKLAQKEFDQTRDRHRAILVTDENNKIVGKLSQLDVIRSLEPKYLKFDDRKELSRFGISKDYMDAILREYHLWEERWITSAKKLQK